jgi:hypothetical protein
MTCCVNAPRAVNKGRRFVVSKPLLPLPRSDQVTVDDVAFTAGGTTDTDDGVLELRSAPGQINAGTRFLGDGRFRITDLEEVTTLPNGREWYAAYGARDATLGVVRGCPPRERRERGGAPSLPRRRSQKPVECGPFRDQRVASLAPASRAVEERANVETRRAT